MRKPEVRPSINSINRFLRRFEAAGLYTSTECIRERAKFARLRSRRPKRK